MHLSADPTAHAETVALRRACVTLDTLSLSGCTIYASGHPCPMCMAAMRMAGVARVVYAYSNTDAAPFGLSTAHVATDLCKPESQQKMQIEHIPWRRADKPHLYELWQQTISNR